MLSNELMDLGLTIRLNKKLTVWGLISFEDLKTKPLPKVGDKVYKSFYSTETFKQRDIDELNELIKNL